MQKKLLWEAYRNSPSLFRTVPSPTPYGLPFPKIGVPTPPETPIAIISGTGKATNFKFGQNNNRVHPNKSHEKFWRKGSVGVSRDCSNFLGTPYYPRNGKSYGFQTWPVYSEGPSEQIPLKILEQRERGRIQGLPIFSGTPYYLRNVKSYSFQIWLVHSEGPSEQKLIKNFRE